MAAPRSNHQCPSHQLPAPLDLLQQQKAHMLPLHRINSPPINRWLTRKRGWRQGGSNWLKQPGQEASDQHRPRCQIGTRAHHFSLGQS
jgi:hypothetical protein